MNYCNCPNCRTDNCPNALDAEAQRGAAVRSSELVMPLVRLLIGNLIGAGTFWLCTEQFPVGGLGVIMGTTTSLVFLWASFKRRHNDNADISDRR